MHKLKCNFNMALKINKGDKYGMLTVLKEAEKKRLPSGQVNRVFTCQCECGNIKDVRLVHLRHNRIKSCGCKHKTMNGKSQTPIGNLYRRMKYRCSKNYFESHLYYDRGIAVCQEWLNSFNEFELWCVNNGFDEKLELDREDNNKGYSPDNCRFVTSKVNCNNRRNTFMVDWEGKKVSLQLLLDELNYPNKYFTVLSRIKRGWDIKKAIYKKPANNYSARR